MPRIVRTLAATVTLVIAASACAGSSTSSSPSTSTKAVPTTAGASTSSIVPPSTVPPPTLSGAATSADAANELVAAWNAHDRTAAGHIAVPDAVEGIFATPDPAMWMRGCTTDDALGEGGCIYLTEKGAVQVNTEKRDVGWIVTSAQWGER